MRIIGGKFKGKKFRAPANIPTRPTTDFAKEGLFNVLSNYYNFDKVSFLDLFSGTGSLSFEFASRGCTDITSVEQFPACARFISESVEKMQIEGMKVFMIDVFKFIEQNKRAYDIIFAGPPYGMIELPTLPDLIIEHKMIEGKGWFILEHNPNHNFEMHPNFLNRRNYGKTIFSIFSNNNIETS
ncbi:MAG: hypothetical protein HKN22_06070 [Bacteroidia bacterium]|nr:hypothetical protein [Bacteroidia bacterium]